MKLKDIKVVGKTLVRAKGTEIDSLQAELWIPFPEGYREYVEQLGEGVLGGSFVRIYPPWRIAKELGEWRHRVRKYWFWEKGKKLLPKERGVECVIIGDTLSGDELVYHPCRPDRIFVLPAEKETIFEAGSTLLEAIEWICSSGKLTKPFSERNFEPFDSRKEPPHSQSETEKGDPDGESLDEIVGTAARWAKRHNLLKWAKEEMQLPSVNIPRAQLQIESTRQFVLFSPKKYELSGFCVSFTFVDMKTKKEVGVSEMCDSGDSQSLQFIPHGGNWDALRRIYGERPDEDDFDDD